MSNKITEKYFENINFLNNENEILQTVKDKINFVPEKEIFRGRIYDCNKVGSLIYQGKWQGKTAVLKIQGIKPEIDEIDIINKFNLQNKSKKIRLPHIYKSLKWNNKDGYGYMLMEFVDAPMIYNPPLATLKEIKIFTNFYEEYRTESLNKPLFSKSLSEESSLVYTTQRILHWAKIAESKNTLNKSDIINIEKFFILAGKHMPSIEMKFMHGHLNYSDIFKISENEYVLTSNLFWSYRPEYYDTTFNLWASIKALRNFKVTIKYLINYIENWHQEYKILPSVRTDSDFERKFNMAMLERCIGALLVDLQNQNYSKDRKKYIKHLTKLFKGLFSHFSEKLL